MAAIEKKQRVAPETLPRFVNAAEASGVRFRYFNDEVPGRYFLPEVMGGGAAWIDFDLDGFLDLYFANGASLSGAEVKPGVSENCLFRNLENDRFAEVAGAAHAANGSYGQGCCIGDFDADGFADIYLCSYGPNALLRNQGDGTFEEVTAAAGVENPQWSSSAIWLDVNGDEYLDLYVVNYLDVTLTNSNVCEYDNKPGYCGPGSYEAAADRMFLSAGNGTFKESAKELGLTSPGGQGLAVVAVDFDDDLQPEIYVANDMAENFLFHTDSKKTGEAAGVRYQNVATSAGCAVSGDGENEASMGVACGDFDGDGRVDLFLTHYYAKKNTLYRNLGGLLFQDDSRRTQIAATSFESLGFGTVALDYDNDGGLDLFIANGHVLGPLHSPNEMQPQLLKNDGHGRFSDVSHAAGEYFGDRWLGRGAAGADYDNDGDVDVAVTHLHRDAALLRNDTQSGHHYLGLDLRTATRIPPVGGRIVITAGERQIRIPVIAGGSYLCSGDPRQTIGLGDWSEPVDIQVFWPSGAVASYSNLAVDRYWRIMEPRNPEPLDVTQRQAD